MKGEYKIIILICYFGKFPWYFAYFLHSCKFNSTIDFLIFSDIAHNFLLPDNVVIVNKSTKEIEAIASGKLSMNVNLDYPYKFCDFKPAYGLIFEDYIEGYDFWGQSDIDVIYGNIRNFMTSALLDSYDFISMRHDYTTGCFALYKNNNLMNTIFTRSRDYKKVLSNPKHYCFDECNFGWDELTAGKGIFEIDTEIDSFTHVIRRAERDGEIKAHFDFILFEGLIGNLKFCNGTLVFKNEFEGILYHLFWLKRKYSPAKVPVVIPDEYYISTKRIYTK